MNDPRMEARRKLEDEERIRRLREGGEDMRAQLAMEEAQKARRTGQEGPAYSGLTPQEEEQRQRMREREAAPYAGLGESQRASMASWGREGREGMTMEDRVARDIRAKKEPVGTAERVAQGDLGRAGGGTYYYEGRESQASGIAAPQSSFGRTDYIPSGKPPNEAKPSPGETVRGKGAGAAAAAGEMGGQAVSRVRDVGEQTLGKTKEYGRRIGEKTREATGGAKAEDMATQAGESIGRGIRKVAAVGAGILSGLRRGVEGPSRERREREMEGEKREWSEEEKRMTEGRETMPRSEYRETEYREVRRKEEPKQ